ncbi:hypothetical protein [Cytobacillus sp. IB215665]|nr:hypothetical protein [Cytobacillus sp. IB215665]MDX8367768.1 hypothetical protein [Cytobacillus sp. IB215665]
MRKDPINPGGHHLDPINPEPGGGPSVKPGGYHLDPVEPKPGG